MKDYWATLSYSERSSEEKRFNILANRVEALEKRVRVLEGDDFEFKVYIELADSYPSASVTFDGEAVTISNDKGTVIDVTRGTYTVTCSATGYVDYSEDITVSAEDNTIIITLEPEPVTTGISINLVKGEEPITDTYDVSLGIDGAGEPIYTNAALTASDLPIVISEFTPGDYNFTCASSDESLYIDDIFTVTSDGIEKIYDVLNPPSNDE